jgi:hypothetical protein
MIRASSAKAWPGSSKRWAEPLWVGLCCLGLLAPSSVGGVVASSRLSVLVPLGMLSFGILFILISGRLSSRWGLILGLTISAVPWLVSWVRMDEVDHSGIGLGAHFLLLGLVFCLPMGMVPSHWVRRTVLPVVEFWLAICAVGVMAGVPAIGRLLVNSFSMYNETLVPNMVALHRPVGPFATHSVAAFAYYLLLFVHLRSYQRRESLVDLSWASFWLIVIGALSSSTAAAMLILGGLDLLWTVIRSQRASIRRIGILAVVACVSLLLYYAWLQRMPLIDLVSRVIGNKSNGLLSRYNTDTGVASASIAYLRLHPFAPIGLANAVAGTNGFLAGQILGDSGPVQYLLRGGPVLLGAVYGGFWVFLRGTVCNKRVAVWLWGVTLAFEVGFSALLVLRVVALIMLTATCLGDIYAGDREATMTRLGVPYQLGRHDDLAMRRYPR